MRWETAHSWMATHLGRLCSARAELGPGPGLPRGCGMGGMIYGLLPYLLFQVINLRAQPLHHSVQLRDLHLGGAEVVPVLTSRPLQLLVLGWDGGRSRTQRW